MDSIWNIRMTRLVWKSKIKPTSLLLSPLNWVANPSGAVLAPLPKLQPTQERPATPQWLRRLRGAGSRTLQLQIPHETSFSIPPSQGYCGRPKKYSTESLGWEQKSPLFCKGSDFIQGPLSCLLHQANRCSHWPCSGRLLLPGTSCLIGGANVRLIPWDLGEFTFPESIQASIGFLNSHINLKWMQCSSLMLIFCQSRRFVIKNYGSGFIISDVSGCGAHLIFFLSWNLLGTSVHWNLLSDVSSVFPANRAGVELKNQFGN